MRLINADALEKEGWSLCRTFRQDINTMVYEVKKLSDFSTIEERKKGNWVGIDDEPCETFECDVCGFVLDDWIEGAFYNFCPNCGADMRGEQDEHNH